MMQATSAGCRPRAQQIDTRLTYSYILHTSPWTQHQPQHDVMKIARLLLETLRQFARVARRSLPKGMPLPLPRDSEGSEKIFRKLSPSLSPVYLGMPFSRDANPAFGDTRLARLRSPEFIYRFPALLDRGAAKGRIPGIPRASRFTPSGRALLYRRGCMS